MTLNQHTVIQTDGLTKLYKGSRRSKNILALDKLTLSVQRGEIFGYLGPNGAGKTTTIRLLLDLIRPTSGSAKLFGMDAVADSQAIRQKIGYLPAELNLWENLTARQIIHYLGATRGGADMNYVNQLAERLQFDLTKKVKSYSTGNKRKLGLIIALMGKPELLILDEPSSGLDPLMQQTFNQLMLEAKAEGRTIFISSHVLSEVQAICDRVAILRHGQLQAVERVDQLTHADFRWVTIRLREAAPSDAFANVTGASEISVDGATVQLRMRGDFDPLLRALAPYYVQDMRVQEPTLEEIFLTYYGETPAANGKNGRGNVNAAAEKELVK